MAFLLNGSCFWAPLFGLYVHQQNQNITCLTKNKPNMNMSKLSIYTMCRYYSILCNPVSFISNCSYLLEKTQNPEKVKNKITV